MQCPRCRQKVAFHINQCPNCQQTLKPLIMSQQVALSEQQRQSLLNQFIKPIAALGFVAGILLVMSVIIKPVPGWAWLALGVMSAGTSIYVLNLVRDFKRGYVLVQIDQLELLQEFSDRSGKHFYGQFSTIGNYQLQQHHYERVIEGNYYVVTYSQHSKIIWELALVTRNIA